MRTHLQIVCAGLLVGALVLAVACGGGGGEGEKQTSIKPAEADLLVSNPSEALGLRRVSSRTRWTRSRESLPSR